ncbi:hypothetical protein P7C71_g4859, partial [Lecanoromycetidae sp. Uapishka_2]
MLFKAPNNNPRWQGTPQPGLNKRIHAVLVFILLLAIWILTFSPWRLLELPQASDNASSSSSSANQSPYAYVTLLAPNPKLDANPAVPDSEDEYFVGTRVLAYQLLHQPSTRTNTSIPLVVICTDDVKPSKIERLEQDGATVVVVEKLHQEWMKPGRDRWRDMLSKLRMLELTQYEKLLFMDSDMVLAKRMDSIFDDPTTATQTPNAGLAVEDEAPLPKEYIFSAQTYMAQRDHPWPMPPGDSFSGGFFLLRPSISMFNYYMKIASIPERFDSFAMEQGLLNYAHRKDGPMPWQEINYEYVTAWPSMKQVSAGAHALHEKFWDHSIEMDEELRDMWIMAKGAMLGYYEHKEAEALAA